MPDFPLAALAAFVRTQLAAVGDRVGGLVGDLVGDISRDPGLARQAQPAPGGDDAGRAATVILAAGAPFAVTAHARARLLRQLHASGLIGARGADGADELLRRHAS